MGSSMDRKLLVWCQDSAAAAAPHLGGRRVKIDNLSSSFVDGWAFAGRVTALSHPGGQRADAPLPDFGNLSNKAPPGGQEIQNCLSSFAPL